MKFAIVVSLGLLALVSPAAAQSPVAVVEDIQGKVTGAEFMDYVTPKSVIKIGENSSIVLSYMNSCRREKISGVGTVIVGTEESTVHLADVKARENELRFQPGECDHAADQRCRRHRAAQRRPEQDGFAGTTAHPLWRIAARGSQGTRQADLAAPRRSRRAAGDQSGRHPAQGKVFRFRQRERRAGAGRPLHGHVQVVARSCSG